MRYAIISDIHSNIQALETVFRLFKEEDIEQVICLGDITGYNANPSECVNFLRKDDRVKHYVVGNHDLASSDNLHFSEAKRFTKDAYDGVRYSQSQLNDKQKRWLSSFPTQKIIEDSQIKFMIRHGAPCGDSFSSDIFEYILDTDDAKEVIKFFATNDGIRLGFFGHTHVPSFIGYNGKKCIVQMAFQMESLVITRKSFYNVEDAFDRKAWFLINPGSVGQPRGKLLPSFVILDTEKKFIDFRSFCYDFRSAQKAIREAGYSQTLAKRLTLEFDK